MPTKKSEKGSTTQVSARVPNEVAAQLQAMADKNDRSLSYIVGYVIKDWLANRGVKT